MAINKISRVLLFDASLVSDNLGDQVIIEYCQKQLSSIFEVPFFIRTSVHDIVGKRTYRTSKAVDYNIVCGTNLLRGNLLLKRQWKVGIRDTIFMNKVCLMGVGWNSYDNEKMDFYAKYVYSHILDKNLIHSVRDEYTAEILRKNGITNVINTACPTMWNLTEEFCKTVPVTKGENVVTTVTNYRPDPECDKIMLDILCRNYNKVYLWLQCDKDYKYLNSFYDVSKLEIINPNLSDYDKLLSSDISLDYVGTRLHGGVRAVNHKRRTLVVEVDNRAKEISRDTKFPTIARENLADNLESVINSNIECSIKIPVDNINLWKSQFK